MFQHEFWHIISANQVFVTLTLQLGKYFYIRYNKIQDKKGNPGFLKTVFLKRTTGIATNEIFREMNNLPSSK